jgi:hypothetical protein
MIFLPLPRRYHSQLLRAQPRTETLRLSLRDEVAPDDLAIPWQGRQPITHTGAVYRKEGPSADITTARPLVTSHRDVLRHCYRLRLMAQGSSEGS